MESGMSLMMDAAMQQFLILLANLIAGLDENQKAAANRIIKNAEEQIAVMEIPFTDKAGMIARNISDDPDLTAETKENLLKEINDFIAKNEKITAIEGIDEVNRILTQSPHLSAVDKANISRICNNSKQTLACPYAMVVNRLQYRHMMELLRSNNMMDQVQVITLKSGAYMFMYNAPFKEAMTQIAISSGYELGRNIRPRPEDVLAQAKCEATGNDATLLRFNNVPRELAEKAVINSGRVMAVTFAKEGVPGTEYYEDGDTEQKHLLYSKYNLTCVGGETEEERNDNYKAAQKVLALSAFSLTGKAKSIELDRMKHSINEQDKLDYVLDCIEDPSVQEEDSGYVYSIHTITDKANDRYIMTDDFIHFSADQYQVYTNGVTANSVRNTDVPDYRTALQAEIESGTGQKVYISENRMSELEKESTEIMHKVTDMIDSGLKVNEESRSKIDHLQTELENESDSTIRLGIVQEMKTYAIIYDAANKNKTNNLTPDMILNGVIASELDTHVFKRFTDKDLTPEMIDDAKIENKAASWFVRQDNIEYVDSENPSIDDAAKILSNISANDYISYENGIAVPASDSAPIGTVTTDDVRHDSEVLDKNMKEHVQEAKDLLDGIEVEREELPEQEKQYPATQKVKQNITSFIEKIRQAIDVDHSPEQDTVTGIETSHEKHVSIQEHETI